MSEKNEQAFRWVFTYNNYTEESYEQIKLKLTSLSKIKYMIIGKEVGSEGTPHLQGYVHFDKRVYRSTIKKIIFPYYGYWAVAKGSEEQNFDYCSKQHNFEEFGERTKAITKNVEKKEKYITLMKDWQELEPDVFDAKWPYESLMLRQKLRQWEAEKCVVTLGWNGDLKAKNLWIWGPPGTGKSRWAREQAIHLNVPIYPKMANKWWGGYDPRAHRIVLFEDFPQDGKYLAQLMKIWADRYSFIGEIKGSSITIEPGRFYMIVTSNYPIEAVFDGEDGSAIKRRFHEVQIRDGNDIFLKSNLPSLDVLL